MGHHQGLDREAQGHYSAAEGAGRNPQISLQQGAGSKLIYLIELQDLVGQQQEILVRRAGIARRRRLSPPCLRPGARLWPSTNAGCSTISLWKQSRVPGSRDVTGAEPQVRSG